MKFTFKNISENISPIENETILADDSVKASPALKSNSDISINSYYEDNTPSNSSQIQIPVYSQSQFITLLPGEQIDIITDDSVQIEYYTNVVDALKTEAYNFAECEISDDPGPGPATNFSIHTTDGTVVLEGEYPIYYNDSTSLGLKFGDVYKVLMYMPGADEPQTVYLGVIEKEVDGVTYNCLNYFDAITIYDNATTNVEDGELKITSGSGFTWTGHTLYDPDEHIIYDVTAVYERVSNLLYTRKYNETTIDGVTYGQTDFAYNLQEGEYYKITSYTDFGYGSSSDTQQCNLFGDIPFISFDIDGSSLTVFDKASWNLSGDEPEPISGTGVAYAGEFDEYVDQLIFTLESGEAPPPPPPSQWAFDTSDPNTTTFVATGSSSSAWSINTLDLDASSYTITFDETVAGQHLTETYTKTPTQITYYDTVTENNKSTYQIVESGTFMFVDKVDCTNLSGNTMSFTENQDKTVVWIPITKDQLEQYHAVFKLKVVKNS